MLRIEGVEIETDCIFRHTLNTVLMFMIILSYILHICWNKYGYVSNIRNIET
jgi:hypothetical protein